MDEFYFDLGQFICLTLGSLFCAGVAILTAWLLCGAANEFWNERAKRLTRTVLVLSVIRDWEKAGRPLVDGLGYDALLAKMDDLVKAAAACIEEMGAITSHCSPDHKARLRLALEPFIPAHPEIESQLMEYTIDQANFDIND